MAAGGSADIVTFRRPLPPLSPTGDLTSLEPQAVERRSKFRVALVNMPFVAARRPSIQCGLLAAIARSHGFAAETFHMNVEFAAWVGLDLHETVASYRGRAIGDWLFASEAFPESEPDPEATFLEHFSTDLQVDAERLLKCRDTEVSLYLDHVESSIQWGEFDVVGFTSSFQQNNASFALARRIKERYPHVTTVFGGSNFEGTMGPEWMRNVPSIDYAVDGEADRAFPRFLISLSEERCPEYIPGVISREPSGFIKTMDSEEPFEDLDELPTPIYDEFFERAERLGVLESGSQIRSVDLPIESARGCWWGAKRHCTFCGLNGKSMAYRSKSPQRALAELADLSQQYRCHSFQVVDNIIETDYIETLFPAIEKSGATYDFFYEVKADLKPDQIERMARAGVSRIQPGIESLNTRVLALMRKGVRASTNVNLLRWCRYHGMGVSWNLLWGFPGEAQKNYDEQAELIPQLAHLEPPEAGTRVWLERFSPLFTDRESFPAVSEIRPEPSLSMVYPPAVDLGEAAYFFDGALDGQLDPCAYDGTNEAIGAWKQAWAEPDELPRLEYRYSPGVLLIDDSRGDEPRSLSLEDPLATLYLLCSDAPASPRQLRERHELPWTEKAIESRLMEMVDAQIMMRDGNLFLALAIPTRFKR